MNISFDLDLDRAARVELLTDVDSTNTYLKALAAKSELADGYAVVAARQTGGRGRMGRSFSSPEGGLYLSVLVYPGEELSRAATLTPCAGVAVCRAIRRVCAVQPDIKWPNDLLLQGRKLCGILTESSVSRGRRFAVIGIGVNVNTKTRSLDETVRDVAVSLAEHTGGEQDCAALAAAVIEELDKMLAEWRRDTRCCLEEYRRLCVSTDREVTLTRAGNSRRAYAVGIDEDYALIARINGQLEHITMGEITLRTGE